MADEEDPFGEMAAEKAQTSSKSKAPSVYGVCYDHVSETKTTKIGKTNCGHFKVLVTATNSFPGESTNRIDTNTYSAPNLALLKCNLSTTLKDDSIQGNVNKTFPVGHFVKKHDAKKSEIRNQADKNKWETRNQFLRSITPLHSSASIRPGTIIRFGFMGQASKINPEGIQTGPIKLDVDFESSWGRDKMREERENKSRSTESGGDQQSSSSSSSNPVAKQYFKVGNWPKAVFVNKMHARCTGYDPKYLKWIISQECFQSIQRSCAVGECPFPRYEEVNSINSTFVIPLCMISDPNDHDKTLKKIKFGVSFIRCEASELTPEGFPEVLVVVGKEKDKKLAALPINVDIELIVNKDPNNKDFKTGLAASQKHRFIVDLPKNESQGVGYKNIGVYSVAIARAFYYLLGRRQSNICAEVRHSWENPHYEVDPSPENKKRLNSKSTVNLVDFIVNWKEISDKWGLQIEYDTLLSLSKHSQFQNQQNLDPDMKEDLELPRSNRVSSLLTSNQGLLINNLFHPGTQCLRDKDVKLFAVIPGHVLSRLSRRMELSTSYAQLAATDDNLADKKTWINEQEKLDKEKGHKLEVFENIAQFVSKHRIKKDSATGSYGASVFEENLFLSLPHDNPAILFMARKDPYGENSPALLFKSHYGELYPEYGVYNGNTVPMDTTFKIEYVDTSTNRFKGGNDSADVSMDDSSSSTSSNSNDNNNNYLDDIKMPVVIPYKPGNSTSKYLQDDDDKELQSIITPKKRKFEEFDEDNNNNTSKTNTEPSSENTATTTAASVNDPPPKYASDEEENEEESQKKKKKKQQQQQQRVFPPAAKEGKKRKSKSDEFMNDDD